MVIRSWNKGASPRVFERGIYKLLIKIVFILCIIFFPAKANSEWLKIGVCSDVHCSDMPNESERKLEEAAIKMSTAMDVWGDIHDNEGGLSAIVICGDYIESVAEYGATMVTSVENELHDYTKVPDSVPRFYAIGNHDWDVDTAATDYMAAVNTNSIQTSQNSGEYFYYDIGNIRILCLTAAYYPDGTRKSGGMNGYLPSEQMSWLENTLQEADALGKYSVVMCHHNLETLSYKHYPAVISNSADVLDILLRHRVVSWTSGHMHADYAHNSYNRTNAYGSRIFFKGLEAMVYASGVSNFGTLYINDQTGQVYMKGHDLTSGKRTLKYVGGSLTNKTDPSLYENWEIVDYDVLGLSSGQVAPLSDSFSGLVNSCASLPQTGDILIIGQDAADAMVPFIQMRAMDQGSSYRYCYHPLEIHIEESFTGEIGYNSAGIDWLMFATVSCLFLEGGFDDTQDGDSSKTESALYFRGIGYLEVRGGADDQLGSGGKFVILGGYPHGYNDTPMHYVYMDANAEDWELLFRDTSINGSLDEGFQITKLDLHGGTVDVIDLVNDDGNNPGVGEVNIYGGRFRLSRDVDDEDVEAGQITIYDGTLDMTTGINGSNGKIIDKLIVNGGDIDLNIENITITNGIEIFAQPKSLTLYNGIGLFWENSRSDLNNDGIVNLLDLAIIANNWCNP